LDTKDAEEIKNYKQLPNDMENYHLISEKDKSEFEIILKALL